MGNRDAAETSSPTDFHASDEECLCDNERGRRAVAAPVFATKCGSAQTRRLEYHSITACIICQDGASYDGRDYQENEYTESERREGRAIGFPVGALQQGASRLISDYRPFNPGFFRLFNSYYKSAGEHWVQGERGQLSRPTVAGIGVESFTDPHERFIDSLWQVNKQVNPGSG